MTPNSQRRSHWSATAKAKAESELLVRSALTKAKVPPLERVSVSVIWYAPDARRRDPDSLATLSKSVLDAMVKVGRIPDDDHSHVHSVTLGPIVIARDNPRIEVVLTEAGLDG